jgi:1,4-dihydroxy-2-naphthoyl-CoA hydrolase
MALWTTEVAPEALNRMCRSTLVEHIGIEFTEVGEDFLSASMPVDERTFMPARVLHGGASVVLSETLGSVAATLCVDMDRQRCVGLEINANHIRAVAEGHVTGTVRPIHIGRTTHLWETRIHDDDGRLICISRITMAVLDR